MTLTAALACLGLDARAKPADVRAAYRRLSLEHHPDRVQDPDDKLAAQRRFMKIRDAYEFLRRRPQLLNGHRPSRPGGEAEAAPDPVEAGIDEVLRRYRELHAVRPSPVARFLGGFLDHWIPLSVVCALYAVLVAALLLRPAG